jgi:hypothetical protein
MAWISATRPHKRTILIQSRTFAISGAPEFLPSKSPICRWALDLATCPHKWAALIFWDFETCDVPLLRPQELQFLDVGYPNSLQIFDTRPKRMDGPDELLRFVTYCVPIPLTLGTPISRCRISRLSSNLCHISHPNGRSRSDLSISKLIASLFP